MFSQVLSASQVQRIHEASLTILSRTGVAVPHPEIMSRFADFGADVDRGTGRVRLSPDLVMRLIGTATKQFTIYGRDLNKTARFGFGERNYNSSAGQALWVERLGGPRRYTTLGDVVAAGKVGDALRHVNIVGAMSDPHEMSVNHRCVDVMAAMIRCTTKPITFWYHDRASARFINEIMIALRGSVEQAAAQPICYPLLEPISPLRFPYNGLDLLFETSRLNLPVHVGPIAQMGLSAPATVAGTIAQENAEVLAGICITQLVREGTPVCYGGVCHAFDMATTQTIFGGPEQAIFGTAMTQMGKHYGLPVYINVGLVDSKLADAQAGLESGVTLAFGAAAGADIFGHLGIVGVDQGASLEILSMQDEVVSYVESVMRTIDFSDEALGLDVVHEVATSGGSFIDQDHTVEHFRRELWFPQMLDRNFYQAWLDGGGTSMSDRCRQRVEKVLAEHVPAPVSSELDKALQDIVSAARRELSTAS